MAKEKIIIGSDHAGFDMKEDISRYLAAKGFVVADAGTCSALPVDYPDIGVVVARKVSAGEFDRGILVCGSGVGMAIVANRFPGVRAVVALDEETTRMSRMHNDSNILALAGRRTDGKTAEKIVSVWLETPFEGGRHQARIDKITELERELGRGK
ncbi:MAG: ribose 5-phosphate isomerase B [Deltaproteobacteria bacterium]|nr:ribose 5-phosphate isomerase B [Deltaproteobacteria bacterium]